LIYINVRTRSTINLHKCEWGSIGSSAGEVVKESPHVVFLHASSSRGEAPAYPNTLDPPPPPRTPHNITHMLLTNTYNIPTSIDGALFMSHVTGIRYDIMLFSNGAENDGRRQVQCCRRSRASTTYVIRAADNRDVAQTSFRDHLRKPGLTG